MRSPKMEGGGEAFTPRGANAQRWEILHQYSFESPRSVAVQQNDTIVLTVTGVGGRTRQRDDTKEHDSAGSETPRCCS